MSTQLKLFSTNGSKNFSRLEKEINDWLATKGGGVQPVNIVRCKRRAASKHVNSSLSE
jgi:hypothetical protein